MTALTNYARYGKNSRFTDIVSKDRLTSAKASDFTNKINILNLPHQIFFYGKDLAKFKKEVNPIIGFNKKSPAQPPKPKEYIEAETNNKVYFVNYDMVQVEMRKIGRGEIVSPKDFGKINVFNEYFGGGLSSIVFQEIREARSLAYSANVGYLYPNEKNKHDYVATYIGTQTNKLKQAIDAMNELMENLPQISGNFNNAKNSTLKQIASQRITKKSIFFNYLAMQKLGFDYDIRKDTYQEVQSLTLDKLTNFYNEKIKPIKYNTAIIGKKENLDMEAIKKLGDFTEVSLEDIFGY